MRTRMENDFQRVTKSAKAQLIAQLSVSLYLGVFLNFWIRKNWDPFCVLLQPLPVANTFLKGTFDVIMKDLLYFKKEIQWLT